MSTYYPLFLNTLREPALLVKEHPTILLFASFLLLSLFCVPVIRKSTHLAIDRVSLLYPVLTILREDGVSIATLWAFYGS
jgi:hypothetical protein